MFSKINTEKCREVKAVLKYRKSKSREKRIPKKCYNTIVDLEFDGYHWR